MVSRRDRKVSGGKTNIISSNPNSNPSSPGVVLSPIGKSQSSARSRASGHRSSRRQLTGSARSFESSRSKRSSSGPETAAHEASSSSSYRMSSPKPKLSVDPLTGTVKMHQPTHRARQMATYQAAKMPSCKIWASETQSKLGKGDYHDNYEYLDLAREKAAFIKHENDKIMFNKARKQVSRRRTSSAVVASRAATFPEPFAYITIHASLHFSFYSHRLFCPCLCVLFHPSACKLGHHKIWNNSKHV